MTAKSDSASARARPGSLSLIALLLAAGSAGCGGAPEAASAASPAADDALAAEEENEETPVPMASATAQSPPDHLPPTGKIPEAGPDGRLRFREVELPDLPTTRERAEALVRRVVNESGTFPDEVQVLDVFVSGRGMAVVDFTLDLVEDHPGGIHAEELTVYSLSHALLSSFPAIAQVRLLVEGRESETLAGHLDLRAGFGRAPDRLLADPDGGGG